MCRSLLELNMWRPRVFIGSRSLLLFLRGQFSRKFFCELMQLEFDVIRPNFHPSSDLRGRLFTSTLVLSLEASCWTRNLRQSGLYSVFPSPSKFEAIMSGLEPPSLYQSWNLHHSITVGTFVTLSELLEFLSSCNVGAGPLSLSSWLEPSPSPLGFLRSCKMNPRCKSCSKTAAKLLVSLEELAGHLKQINLALISHHRRTSCSWFSRAKSLLSAISSTKICLRSAVFREQRAQ